jgi:glutaredoxin
VRRLVPSDCATKATLNGSALDAKGILYDIVDLSENDAALEYVKELGYSQAPVVVVDDQTTGPASDRTRSSASLSEQYCRLMHHEREQGRAHAAARSGYLWRC